jgi:histidinol-phosphatase (PHP family)
VPADYLAAAEKAGLAELGVADHFPWPDGYDPQCRMFTNEYPLYHDMVMELRNSQHSVKVKYGIELDYVPGRMDEVFAYAEKYDYDYIIGSIHYTDDFPFDSPEHIEVWKDSEKSEQIWTRYYELLLEFVSLGGFDIIGHFDLPKKFGSIQPDTGKIRCLIDDILTAAADNSLALEINTGGLRQPGRKMYPAPVILTKAAAKGVRLTLGSDAHAPNQVSANFADALVLAKESGFKELTIFDRRSASSVAIV